MENQKTQIKEIVVKKRSTKTAGILSDEDVWHNYPRGIEPTQELLNALDALSEGDLIALQVSIMDPTVYFSFEVLKKAEKKGQLKDGTDIVSFDDVLARAHKEWGDHFSIMTEWLNAPDQENPLFKATVIIEGNRPQAKFTGHGEATEKNTDPSSTGDARPRMAETRAIARALRFALGTKIIEVELPKNDDKTVPVRIEDLDDADKNFLKKK